MKKQILVVMALGGSFCACQTTAPPERAAVSVLPVPESAAALPAPERAASPCGPDRARSYALLSILSDPWATPAQQALASQQLQLEMPSRPTIIDGPIDPQTHYPTKLLFSPTQGVLGRVNADGSITPVGAGGTLPNKSC